MRHLKKSISFLALALIMTSFFTSCKEDESNEMEVYPPSEIQEIIYENTGDMDSTELAEILCFDFIYPISFEVYEGETITLNSLAEVESFFENNEDESDFCPKLIYPVSAVTDEGNTIVLEDEEDLEDLLESCGLDVEDEDDYDGAMGMCFDFVFPIQIQHTNGEVVTFNSLEELISYVDANIESWDEDPELLFPIDVVIYGETVTLNNEDELEELYEISCEGDYDMENDFEFCYGFVYPLTIDFPNGDTAVVNNLEELEILLINWYENSLTDECPMIAYPYQVVLDDNSIATINNEDEEEDIFSECYDDGERGYVNRSIIIQNIYEELQSKNKILRSLQ